MSVLSPVRMIVLGGVLVVVGFLLPLLMLLHVIPSTFLLNFIAYAASFFGLTVGVIGSAMSARIKRQQKDRGF